MRMHMLHLSVLFWLAGLVVIVTGCNRSDPQPTPATPAQGSLATAAADRVRDARVEAARLALAAATGEATAAQAKAAQVEADRAQAVAERDAARADRAAQAARFVWLGGLGLALSVGACVALAWLGLGRIGYGFALAAAASSAALLTLGAAMPLLSVILPALVGLGIVGAAVWLIIRHRQALTVTADHWENLYARNLDQNLRKVLDDTSRARQPPHVRAILDRILPTVRRSQAPATPDTPQAQP